MAKKTTETQKYTTHHYKCPLQALRRVSGCSVWSVRVGGGFACLYQGAYFPNFIVLVVNTIPLIVINEYIEMKMFFFCQNV